MGVLERYLQLTQPQPEANVSGYQAQQPQLPVIDTSNAIGSLAELLGPTPAEREAQELRRQQGKAKMQMWAGLFDGLRQLGNLYAATKGATPQKYTDNPYQQVEQMADAQRQREDALTNYGRQYYASLYNMQRQLNDDKRRNLLAEAQANYYNTRDEVARMKAENDRLKNEKYVQLLDGRIAKVNAETGKIEKLLPYQEDKLRSEAQRNRQTGAAAVTRANNSGKGKTGKTSKSTNEQEKVEVIW